MTTSATMTRFEEEVRETQEWLESPRFGDTERLYSAREVVAQRGTIDQDYTVAREAAEQFYARLRELFANKQSITTFGPYSPGQAVAMKRQGEYCAVSVVSSMEAEDPRRAAVELLKGSIERRASRWIDEHEAIWSDYWSASGIEIDDRPADQTVPADADGRPGGVLGTPRVAIRAHKHAVLDDRAGVHHGPGLWGLALGGLNGLLETSCIGQLGGAGRAPPRFPLSLRRLFQPHAFRRRNLLVYRSHSDPNSGSTG